MRASAWILLALAVQVLPAGAVTVPAGASSGPSAQQLAVRLGQDGSAMASARAQAARLRAGPGPATPLAQLRQDLRVARAEYDFRHAARDEQEAIYRLAADPALLSQVLREKTAPPGLAAAADGLRGQWRSAGIGDFALVNVRHSRRFRDSEPVDALLGYYQAAAARYGLDWTYLAAINYVESDFGRSLGPSAAGAVGPMQFLPSTWAEVGAGGDIMSEKDSVMAAARYLRRRGAPADYARAVLGYNASNDYLAAVQGFAGAMRADPLWLWRLYYWNTYG